MPVLKKTLMVATMRCRMTNPSMAFNELTGNVRFIFALSSRLTGTRSSQVTTTRAAELVSSHWGASRGNHATAISVRLAGTKSSLSQLANQRSMYWRMTAADSTGLA